MRSKSLKTLLRITLLTVLLGTSSTAYADAFTQISFNDFSISTSANNPVTFGAWQGTVTGIAVFEGVVVNQTASTTGGTLQLVATTPLIPGLGVSFARGAGLIDASNVTGTAFAQAHPNGCTCSGAALGHFVLSNTFIVSGGTDSADVTLALRLATIQTLALDEFDFFATAQVTFDLTVDGTTIFSHDHLLSSSTPNSFTETTSSEVLFRTITLQPGTPHTITITGTVRSAALAEIPEPATLFLLASGLGFLGGVAKKRRGRFSAR